MGRTAEGATDFGVDRILCLSVHWGHSDPGGSGYLEGYDGRRTLSNPGDRFEKWHFNRTS